MSEERWARVKRSMEPAWNDLREQRLLVRVQEAKRTRLATKSRPVVWLAAAAVLLAAIVGLATYKLRHTDPAPIANVDATPKMQLADGSEVALTKDAQVKLEEQGEEQVRLLQTAGEAKYDVKPNPKRRFIVKAADVEVRVLGTAFTVTMEKEKVRVHVLRGRVEVEGGGKTTLLSIGETLEVPAIRPIDPTPSQTAPPAPTETKKPAGPTVEELLKKADEARAGHRYDEAATALRTMIASYPGDPRVSSALFTLGRVERMRGKHAAAADAFARCYKAAPHGALAEDALSEEAMSWKNAGDSAKAKAAAQRYLKQHPSGPHAARMMPLTE
jgi:transmembrane sensor